MTIHLQLKGTVKNANLAQSVSGRIQPTLNSLIIHIVSIQFIHFLQYCNYYSTTVLCSVAIETGISLSYSVRDILPGWKDESCLPSDVDPELRKTPGIVLDQLRIVKRLQSKAVTKVESPKPGTSSRDVTSKVEPINSSVLNKSKPVLISKL